MRRKGSSTGLVPNHVKNRKIIKKDQNEYDLKFLWAFWYFILVIAKGIIIRIDISRPITPPNFLGIDRKIAYANRKYHSGWICVGVTNEFAGIKFSGSIKKKGILALTHINKARTRMALTISLNEK